MCRLLMWVSLFLLVCRAAAGADIVVYNDSTQAGFDQGCSFPVYPSPDFDFANTAPTHAASAHSIRFTPDYFNAVSWCKSSGPVSATTDFPSITFWVYLTSSAQGSNIDLVLNLSTSTSYYPASLQTIFGAPIPAGTWVQLHTVFASGPIGYGGTFDHISLQDETGLHASDTVFRTGFDAPFAATNVYFDDVVLQSAATTTYTVSAVAGSNGAISPASQIVPSGNTASFTVTPSAGYHVTSVTGDHCTVTQQGATTTWLSSAITQNCSVAAAFAINSYTVTPSAGAGGSLTPSTPQTVNYNATTNFTVGANAHYHVVNVNGCGGSLSGSTYTTGPITANCTVTATFALDTYTVTPSAGSGGSLTPSTPQTVNYNATTNFTVGANTGYHIVSVSGCGGALVASTYTTGPITASCTVTATFASDTPPPSCGLTEHHDQSVVPAAGDTMISDVFDWCDSAGKPREAVLAHNNQTGKQAVGGYPNHGGSLQQFSYKMPDNSTRTATITTYGNGGYGGFGYVVSHSAWLSDGFCAGDDSPLGYSFAGTWTRVFEGRHHAIFRFQQNYQRHCGPNNPPPTTYVPVTIDWVFSTGRDNPLWAITYDIGAATKSDATAIAADFLFDDSRAPYGELNIDGDGFSHDIDGVAWGDDYKFTSTTAPVTLSSAWTWNVANTIPYVKEWIVASNATMGLVQTQTITQQDAGGGRNPYYQDLTAYWGKTSAAGNACPSGGYSMPCQDGWPYQANNDSIGVAPNSNNNARLTWGTQYGFLGQTSYASNQTKAVHPDDGPYLSGWPKKSYSVYVVLGPHTASPVETQVTQVETIQSLTLTATTGSVVTTGPAGVNRADTITYAPPGYDHIYSALAFNAASNVLDANINVGSGTLKKPLIIVHNYTSASYPASVKLNGTTLTMDTDYFPSLRSTASELWITLDKDLSGATNHLEINTSSAAAVHWVDGYHVGYESGDLPINQVNFNDVTHLMIGAVLPNTDGTLDTTFYIDAVNGPAWAQSAVTAAHTAGRKAMLMIGGAGSITGWRGAASAANLDTFVTNLSNAATTYGADGLDIDWEPTTDNNASNAQITTDHTELANLVQALHTARPDLLLTMPVGAYNPNYAPNVSEQSLFTTITPLLDQINLMSYSMAYDYPGWYSWFASALTDEAPNTPLSVASSIAYYQGLGVPNSKLGVGIGFYGICYNNVSQPRQDLAAGGGYIANGDDNVMTYAHIASAYIPNMTYTYDATAKAPWLAHATAVAPEGCTYVTYENAASIADKGSWVSANGLGGTIIWTLAKGHLGNGNDPLLDAAHAAFP